ncbi:AraC family transcriptional regulator [Lysobacter sp. MMG2]|uniref:AraC family transcriptional regulator n=1 Tax=Lysobacter sp. MMG2 TaxID=2801338 RepID=UPI001C24DF01|nr:AraC family transcriptional regulator [Lysobacter sp. MMG2]MBU8976843.1 AraC family transcriptional regulator [Lysobacter sp. MMG2]
MPSQHINDDARLNTATIKSGIVAGLVAMAREHGVASEPWFSGLRLGPAAFDGETPVYLSYRQAGQIIRRAVRSLPVRGPGLVLGERQTIGHFGLLGLAMLTAPRFAQALQLAIKYAPITGAMVELELDEYDDGAMGVIARMHSVDAELEPFLCEELFASSLMLCRGLLGAEFRPRLLELAYAAPSYASDYTHLFACEVRFDAPRNRVVIDPRWLQATMPAGNTASAQQIIALCEEQMPAGQPRSEIVAVVERLLRQRLADNPREVEIAAELHLTERTLRRQLHAAQTTFSELHDRVRSESARALLADSRVSIAHVGAAVGFKDAREFRRAFKRWTGVAPREMRAGEKSGA